jgi:hypothetical protein
MGGFLTMADQNHAELGQEIGRAEALAWSKTQTTYRLKEIAVFGANFRKNNPRMIEFLRKQGWKFGDKRFDSMEYGAELEDAFEKAFISTKWNLNGTSGRIARHQPSPRPVGAR